MFLNTDTLNEGAGLEKEEPVRKRELQEGNNPRVTCNATNTTRVEAHTNYRWQKLRK